MSQEYIYTICDIEFGPVPLETMLDLIASGMLGANDRFKVMGGDWGSVKILMNRPDVIAQGESGVGANAGLITESTKDPEPPRLKHYSDIKWFYQAESGTVGPLTTAAFIGAVYVGSIGPETRVRFEDSEWIVASEINGLTFQGNKSGTSIDNEPVRSVKACHDAPRLNPEMQKLFGECAQRQNHSRTQKAARNVEDSSVGWVASSVTRALVGIISYPVAFVSWVIDVTLAALSRGCRSQIVRMTLLFLVLMVLISSNTILPTTQRQVRACVTTTLAEFRRLREQEGDDDAWRQFQKNSVERLERFVPYLEESADIMDPESLALLGIVRDDLLHLLRAPDRESEMIEQRIQLRLETIKSDDVGVGLVRLPWDIVTSAIIISDLLLACAVVWWLFVKSRSTSSASE